MELRTPAPLSDDEIYRFRGDRASRQRLDQHRRLLASTSLGGEVSVGADADGVTPKTMISDPVVVCLDGSGAAGSDSVRRPPTASGDRRARRRTPASRRPAPCPDSHAALRRPGRARQGDSGRQRRPSGQQAARPAAPASPCALFDAGMGRFVGRSRGDFVGAWPLATFTSPDAIKKIVNFDSALASYSNGEPEVLPIYADPDNIPRDRAIGDEHASTPGEAAPVVLADGGSDSEGEESGGMIVAGGVGSGRPSNTPRVRGVGKGRINEGSSLPGVKIDGLGGSPLSLIPAAPAADLSGGGKIAGDPIFDVKEIGVALDQLAREILRHLKDHKLTVVWLFDESTSMQDDQRTILEKFDRVSSELKLNVEPNKKSAGALNHAIVGFGQGIDYVLEKPREDIDQIGRAIKHLKIDPTGIENTMQAIRDVVEHYANLIRKDRRLLIVLVTDESGDDGADVEEARQALKKYKVPLFVIGRQSLFGYPFAHHQYIDPVTKDVYHPLIRRGPETADLELYQWDGLLRPLGRAAFGVCPLRAGSPDQGLRRHLFCPAQRRIHADPPARAGLLDHAAQGVPSRVRQPADLR